MRRLCKRFGVFVLESDVAPSGQGDASVWVRQRFADCVRLLRSRRHQHNLGLLVAIDGDNKGVAARKAELAAGAAARGDGEAIALFVPTWSIETWMALLDRGNPVVETEPLKDRAGFRDLWDDGQAESETLAAAVQAWHGEIEPCASLADAYLEASRVGLHT